MWSPTISSDELYHHGILGMRWGRRNGPPYPLDPADHSQSEKKAGYQKSISGLSEGQRKTIKTVLIVGGVTIAGIGAAYVISQHPDTFKKFASHGKEIVNNIKDANIDDLGAGNIKLLEDKSSNTIAETITKGSNITYDKTIDKCIPKCKHIEKDYFSSTPEEKAQYLINRNKCGGSYNCQAGTLSFEISRRGGDVTAKDIDTTNIDDTFFMQKCYKNFTGFKKTGKVNSVLDYEKHLLSEFKEGQRGRITIWNANGIGHHSMAFEVKDSKLKVFDSESRREVTLPRYSERAKLGISLEKFEYCRTDNLELNDESGFIRRVVKSN